MEFEYLLRVLIAGVCGAIIGYERKNRMKEAGIRTHLVVAVGASLMMVLSKYGFQDQLGWHNLSLDPSRISAQVVSGIGFLGAGMIFLQRHTIKGLTTAAGIWATSGIGMTIGSGLYWVGIGVTLIILLAQMVLYKQFNWLTAPRAEQILLRVENEQATLERVQQILAERGVLNMGFHAEKKGNDFTEIEVEISIKLPGTEQLQHLLTLIQEIPAVRSVEFQ
ncbi:MgtC/SapB family protein [Brevibacillus fluminis]|uniref:MgtC/SapB family protein n=1 Tax=Brevibacillus fluminis TaxID=511487 RepID=A0A3M8DAJ7_9BACL|nr:MgtC/SapB family protein [Brevibacillus fluminis]RNB84998.1 MgtC/SapB family protein [Brevibacillus fluminis]